MKKLKNWKFIFTIGVIFIFISLFYVLFIDMKKLPSANWSRKIEILEYELSDSEKNIFNHDVDLIAHQDHFLLAYYSDNQIHIAELNKKFELQNTKIISDKIDDISKLKLYRENANQINVIYATEHQLNYITLDHNKNVIDNKLIDENINHITIKENSILYSKDQYVYSYNISTQEQHAIYSTKHMIQDIANKKFNNMIYYAIVEFDTVSKKTILNLNTYNMMTKQNKNYAFETFTLGSSNILIDLDIGVNDEEVLLISIFKDQKFNFNNIFSYKFDQGNLENYSEFQLSTKKDEEEGYTFMPTDVFSANLQIINAKPFMFTMINFTDIGRVDISKRNDLFPNIVLYDTEQNDKVLTKTVKFNNKSKFFQHDGHRYLIFGIPDGNTNKLYITSDDPAMIARSLKIRAYEYRDLIFATISTFIPILFLSIIPLIIFLLPILMILFTLSLHDVTKVENHPKRYLSLSIIIYLIIKVFFVFYQFQYTNLPVLWTSPLWRMIVTSIFTVMAFYCLYDYVSKRRMHFVKKFIFFYALDATLFILFFTPYKLI